MHAGRGLAQVSLLCSIVGLSTVHYVIWRDVFVQIELGVEIANLGVE